ncbi:MAG: TIGR04086 family membrane protein [bacterium]|nr:TIGR04086 family membrane protein [bacterium]
MGNSRFVSLFKVLLFSYVLTALLLLLLALALYKLQLDEFQVSFGVHAIYLISCLLGGFLSGKIIRQRRFFWGLILGCLYFGCLFLASFAVTHTLPSSSSQTLLNFLLCICAGIVGGVLS